MSISSINPDATAKANSNGSALDSSYRYVAKPASALTPDQLEAAYKLVRNIRGLYAEAGDPWIRRDKIEEMRDTPELEYLLVYAGSGSASSSSLVAFVSYVLADIDDHDQPTTFIYELHVSPALQRTGLGKYLLHYVQGQQPSETSMTLRTFSCNKPAVGFYTRLGFVLDSSISSSAVLFLVLPSTTRICLTREKSN